MQVKEPVARNECTNDPFPIYLPTQNQQNDPYDGFLSHSFSLSLSHTYSWKPINEAKLGKMIIKWVLMSCVTFSHFFIGPHDESDKKINTHTL